MLAINDNPYTCHCCRVLQTYRTTFNIVLSNPSSQWICFQDEDGLDRNRLSPFHYPLRTVMVGNCHPYERNITPQQRDFEDYQTRHAYPSYGLVGVWQGILGHKSPFGG
jgi:hypothetical protein